MKLTVAIRDDSPVIFCGDSPSYRLVEIELTDEQASKIVLRDTGCGSGKMVREEISRCYLSPSTGDSLHARKETGV